MIKLLLFSRIMTVPGAGDSERILSGVKRVILVLSGEESLILFTKYSIQIYINKVMRPAQPSSPLL